MATDKGALQAPSTTDRRARRLPSRGVVVAALVGVFLLLWFGLTLLLDARSNRRAAELVERLRPYQ